MDGRFTIRDRHELYCAGHLIEAAVAYYKATGRDRFLKLMCKYADYIERVFIKEKSADFITPGHEEIELALVKLYECTKDKRYLDMAVFFIDQRGNNEKEKELFSSVTKKYDQSHLPLRMQETAEGHAVRACYLYSAMADVAKETNSIYADIVEKALYNGMLSGISLDGKSFFYVNPLGIDPQDRKKDTSVIEQHKGRYIICTSIHGKHHAQGNLQGKNYHRLSLFR